MYLFSSFISALLLILIIPVAAISQQIETDLPENWSETLSDEESPDPSLWADLNEWYQEHPVSLKNATRQQLLELPGMDGLVAEAILNYQAFPGFQNLSQLSEIPEISSSYQILLEKWLVIDSNGTLSTQNQKISSESRHRTRIAQFSVENIRIKKMSIYNRVKVRTQSGWTAGLISEKDKDESNLTDYVNGTLFFKADSQSGWVGIHTFSAGAYQLAFGEGLLFSRSATLGKSSAVISSPIKNSSGLLPYLSSDENRFLSGVSGSVLFPKPGIETGVFYSSARYDGDRKIVFTHENQGELSLTEDFRFDNSGLHSNQASLSKKDKLPVTFLGGWVKIDGLKNLSFTSVAGLQIFDRNDITADSALVEEQAPSRFERFRNYDEKVRFISLSGQFTTPKVVISGEIARFGEKSAMAWWVLCEPLSGFKYILHHRNAEPGFTPLFGRPFADKMSSPGNETGWYQGLEFTAFTTLFSFYRDEFLHPWPGYQNLYPSKGIEWFAGVEKKWVGSHDFKVQYRFSAQNKEISGSSVQNKTRKYRIEWSAPIVTSIQFKSRLDLNQTVKTNSGKAFTGQIKTTLFEKGNLILQCSWFDANIYDDRIYVYESDLPGMMSFNPLYGEGFRISLITGNEIFRWMKLSLKLSFESSQRFDDGKSIQTKDGFAGVQFDFNN